MIPTNQINKRLEPVKRRPRKNLRKVNDINPEKYYTYEFDYSPVSYDKDGTVEERIKTKPVTCVFFGCGRKLTLQEKLCGDRCRDHQKHQVDIMNCISV